MPRDQRKPPEDAFPPGSGVVKLRNVEIPAIGVKPGQCSNWQRHFLSHYYGLCLPPMFVVWQQSFGVSLLSLSGDGLMSRRRQSYRHRSGFWSTVTGAAVSDRRHDVMTLSIAAMGLATEFWQIVLLAMLSGSAIRSSIRRLCDPSRVDSRDRMGRSFSFTPSAVMSALPPPAITAALILLIGWRNTLLLVGLVGIPVVLSIIWQSRILTSSAARDKTASKSRCQHAIPVFAFDPVVFGFFLVSSMPVPAFNPG